MRTARNITLVLAGIAFAVALAAHTASFLDPARFLSPELISLLRSDSIGWIGLIFVAIPIAGFIIAADLLVVYADTDLGRMIGGIVLLIQLFLKTPRWIRLIPIVFLGI